MCRNCLRKVAPGVFLVVTSILLASACSSPPTPISQGFYRVVELDTVFFTDYNLIGLQSANDSLYWTVSTKHRESPLQSPFDRDTTLVVGGDYRLELDRPDSSIQFRTWIEDWSGDYHRLGVHVVSNTRPLVELFVSADIYGTNVRYGAMRDTDGAR